MIAKLVTSSVVNPNVIVPKPIRLTMRPDRPRCPYVIASLTLPRVRIALLSYRPLLPLRGRLRLPGVC
jgi:hypothetical protein